MTDRGLSPLFTWRSAICDSDLPPTTRHVLLTLSLHMNERGGSCFPSTRTLATETGLSRRSVEKHLRLAHDAHWIEKREQGRKADGTFRRAEYTATIPGELASHGPGEPHAQPGEPDDIDQGNEVPHRTSVLRGRQQRGRTSAGAAEFSTAATNGKMDAGQLVGAWIDVQPIRPAPTAIKKQGAVAKRICEARDPKAIHYACSGMQKLYPHSDGEPWDLFDLERKFDKAVQAELQPDRSRKATDTSWLEEMFPDEE